MNYNDLDWKSIRNYGIYFNLSRELEEEIRKNLAVIGYVL